MRIHRSSGADSAISAATHHSRRGKITVIGGGCPLTFGPITDAGPGDAPGLRLPGKIPG